VSRLGRTALAIASAAFMAAALTAAMAAPALAQSAHPTSSAQTSARSARVSALLQEYRHSSAAATEPCGDGVGISSSTEFWRCTGSSETSTFVGSPCTQGSYNAGSYYNVWGAINECPTRVWLHENEIPPSGATPAGWSVCIAPAADYPYNAPIFTANLKPENIQVVANDSSCVPVQP
jgi:hypothetical protein